jgi:hypothetical protein
MVDGRGGMIRESLAMLTYDRDAIGATGCAVNHTGTGSWRRTPLAATSERRLAAREATLSFCR